MLETGQPLLMFDGAKITDFSIYSATETYSANDFKIYEGDILFYNKNIPFANLGFETTIDHQITKNTDTFYFVSINPQAKIMQANSKKHLAPMDLLLTRLTKPIVADYCLIALQRLLFLLRQNNVDFEVLGFSHDIPYQAPVITHRFSVGEINQILGTNIKKEVVINILTSLGCKITCNQEDLLLVNPPMHRNDFAVINDYAEEIARILGYNNLVSSPIFITAKNTTAKTKIWHDLQNYLLANGFSEVKTYNLTSKNNVKIFDFFHYHEPITLLSPNSTTKEVMRFSLLESLIAIHSYNVAHKQPVMKIFTSDTIYSIDEKRTDDYYITLLLPEDNLSQPFNISKKKAFFYLKGVLFAFLKTQLPPQVIDNIIYEKQDNPLLHPYCNANLLIDNCHIATLAALNLGYLKNYDLKSNLYFSEINFTRLVKIIAKYDLDKNKKFTKWSKYNPITLDLSIIIDKKNNYTTIQEAINKLQVPFITSFNLFDIYEDEKLNSENQHSLTLNFQFNSFNEQLDHDKIKTS